MIVIISLFIHQCEDSKCETLVSTLKEVVRSLVCHHPLPLSLRLDKYVSPHYMGLFLNDQEADPIKKLSARFISEIAGFCMYLFFNSLYFDLFR